MRFFLIAFLAAAALAAMTPGAAKAEPGAIPFSSLKPLSVGASCGGATTPIHSGVAECSVGAQVNAWENVSVRVTGTRGWGYEAPTLKLDDNSLHLLGPPGRNALPKETAPWAIHAGVAIHF